MDMVQLKLFGGRQKGFDHPLLSEMSGDFYLEPIYATEKGILYEGDCLQILPHIKSETVDTVFADPPFNLKKNYGGLVNDNLTPKKYLSWCRQWIHQCARVLKKGGSFFIYNIPKWNVILESYLILKIIVVLKMENTHD